MHSRRMSGGYGGANCGLDRRIEMPPRGSPSDVVMSGVLDCGHETGHRDIDVNDPDPT